MDEIKLEGKWWSTYYNWLFCKGNISITLPKNIPNMYATQARIKYTGIYRFMCDEVLPVIIVNNGETQTISAQYGRGVLTYTVKMDGDNVEGTYKLDCPIDVGIVKMKKV